MTDTTDTTTLATGALVTAATDADMRALGRRIAGLLRPGDLLIMSGPLAPERPP